MDTLVVAVPRRRAYGLIGLAALLAAATLASDSTGRLLAAPAAVAVLALAVRDMCSGPVLRAGPGGLEVLVGLRRTAVGWERVDRMRVVKDRRTELLELDLGSALAVFSAQRLGRRPAEVLTDLLAVRSTAAAGEGAAPGSPEHPAAIPD